MKHTSCIVSILLACVTVIISCGEDKQAFVINELMASNKTGLLAADGKTHDWIELRNVTDETQNLRDYVLEKKSGKAKWEFPDSDVKAGECIVVFATKKKVKGELSCGFKLSAKGDTVKLIGPHGTVISTAGYKKLHDDEALKLTKNDKYKKTYYTTPGFENNEKGLEAYFQKMEAQRKDPLKIWECLNKSRNALNSRQFEIRNVSDKPVDLTPYSIINDKDKPRTLSLPHKVLAPGKSIVVTDDSKRLKGESFILLKDKKFADGINCAETYMDISVGRMEGKAGFYYFPSPTIGAENHSDGFRKVQDKPDFITVPGVYQQKTMVVKLKDDDATVHYTLDGSLPTEKSPVYKDSILITKSTVIHAVAIDSTKVHSPIVTATFLLDVKHSLPVVCVTMKSSDLYDVNTGIYVKGPGAEEEFPYYGANYWKPWEKLAHIEFFDGKEGFSYDCGIKIFGAYSRTREKKSFLIRFRRRYGHPKLKYDLYGNGDKDEVKALVLRSGSQDDNGTMVRDEFFTTLMQRECPTLHVQAYRPVVLYINGEYFGVYFVREKVNEDFVANHLHVDPETATVLVGVGAAQRGDNAEYKALVAYVRSHSMTDSKAYAYVKSKVDFNSLIDYKIGEFYTGNCDVGNIRFFKSSDKACDNKWYWLYYDLDWGFYYDTPLSYYIRENAHRESGASLAAFNVLIDRLLKNPEFRQLFLERWGHHRNKTFSEKNALALFNQMIETIQPEMERNYKRWPQSNMRNWETHVEHFRAKIKKRPAQMDEQIQLELHPTAEEKKKYHI